MKTPIILVVDDEPNNFDVIETLLDIEGCELHYSAEGQDAISFLELITPDLILLDVMMPITDGIEVCQYLKANPQYKSIPVIMVTALTGRQDLAKCFEAGAEDFISKPIDRLELNARVRSMLKIRSQHQQLQEFNRSLEATVQKRTEQLRNLIIQDSLTKLPSLTYLIEFLTELPSDPEFSVALIIIDCDNFNLVNGSFGYSFGDRLLVAISQRLQQEFNDGEMLVRLGENRFGLLIKEVAEPNIDEIEPLLQKITHSLKRSFVVADCEVFMSFFIGIAFTSNLIKTPIELIQAADTAIYQAKLQGKSNIQLFCPQMHLEIQNRLILETELKKAVENQEFINFYQPIINLKTLKTSSFEALVRWQHPQKGLVSPGKFIPSMETSGLIIPAGIFILRQACEQLQQWHQQGMTSLTMSVNLSTRQFNSPTLLVDIDRILAETQINPAYLKLEITESAILDRPEDAIALTQELRSRKIKISIDDFGTGYSSLSYLESFQVDHLKIDRSFVRQITPEKTDYPIVNAIISLAKQLQLSIIAEGIETEYQLCLLQKLGCDFGQGYLFAKPLPVNNLEFTI